MSLIVNIVKRYAGFTLDVAFESDRESLAIVGASGSGKSMTLKCIAGLLTPDEGYIEVDGRVLYDSRRKINLRPQQRKVGYLLQNNALFPNMTVEKNIAQALSGSTAENSAVIRELLKRFELADFGWRYPSQLSGGQQQRVALARILAGAPSVLMLDEPFSALDAYLKETLQLDMKRRLEEYDGHSIMVTHDRDEAYRLCPKLLLLERGRVDVFGDTADLFQKPPTLTAARLTGCKNLSPAERVDDSHVRAVDWNVTLRVAGRIPDDLSHIGIRAHTIAPAADGGGDNVIRLADVQRIDSPFSCHVLFSPAGADRKNPIWWTSGKDACVARLPDYVRIDPDDVLLLRRNADADVSSSSPGRPVRAEANGRIRRLFRFGRTVAGDTAAPGRRG